ncbi:hypothetical protein B0O80DRAFT_448010 [Mortierella sp. GBAus27b]|nr:hypothetical protein B0O80DRAFT_448010 [Mortierella sp. GBAus27b]
MHTSVGSVGSDSFLGPHEPPHNLKSQFRHQYFHSLTPSSQASSPSRFAEGYTRHPHHPHSPQSPSPEYRQSWYTTQNHEKIPTRMIRRQDSSSSIASSETVSSSSTCSMVDSVVSRGARVTDHYPETLPGTLNSRSHEESLSQDQLESPMVPLPLPVYPSKTRDEEHRSFSEKVPALLDVVALPEIAPLGDLLSEFAVDFGPAQ